MTPEDRNRLRDLQIKADFEDDIPSHGTLKAQWTADQIALAERQDACYIERLARQARKDGGAWRHPPRKQRRIKGGAILLDVAAVLAHGVIVIGALML